jgi:hypothetical protein
MRLPVRVPGRRLPGVAGGQQGSGHDQHGQQPPGVLRIGRHRDHNV